MAQQTDTKKEHCTKHWFPTTDEDEIEKHDFSSDCWCEPVFRYNVFGEIGLDAWQHKAKN